MLLAALFGGSAPHQAPPPTRSRATAADQARAKPAAARQPGLVARRERATRVEGFEGETVVGRQQVRISRRRHARDVLLPDARMSYRLTARTTRCLAVALIQHLRHPRLALRTVASSWLAITTIFFTG